jgi:hypothetical protein
MFYALGVDERFCPKCGAYWKCDCRFDDPPAVDWSAQRVESGCNHDWNEVLGVDLDETLTQGEALVLVCRLCGLYAVEERV